MDGNSVAARTYIVSPHTRRSTHVAALSSGVDAVSAAGCVVAFASLYCFTSSSSPLSLPLLLLGCAAVGATCHDDDT